MTQIPQTVVASAPDIGKPGMFANLHTAKDGKVVARTSEEASASLPFGAFVAKGTADRGVKALSSTADLIEGIALAGDGYNRDSEVDANGFRPACTFDVGQTGEYFVTVEGAVTPASEVHLRVVASGGAVVGLCRATADAGKTIDISAFAKFNSTAADGKIVEISIDIRNRGLATAD